MSDKYPRTYHFPFSPGKTNDDKVIECVDYLLNTPVILSFKMDGGNCAINKNNIFARTHATQASHPSFNIIKQLQANIKHLLLDKYDYFGENCYAKHSIEYNELPAYFLLFAIRDNEFNKWLSWKEIEKWSEVLSIPTVPVAKITTFKSVNELKNTVEFYANQKSICGGEVEGIVVRTVDEFEDEKFSTNIAKWVRKNHVNTDKHWSFNIITPNKLKQNQI